MFSQRATVREVFVAFLPRAFATTFAAMDDRRVGEVKDYVKSPYVPSLGKGFPWWNAPRGRADESTRPLATATKQLHADYLRCLLTSFVISNIETCPLPPNTGFRLSSALI